MSLAIDVTFFMASTSTDPSRAGAGALNNSSINSTHFFDYTIATNRKSTYCHRRTLISLVCFSNHMNMA